MFVNLKINSLKSTPVPVDKFLKREIIEHAKFCGADWDGDSIVYKGRRYIVDIKNDRVFLLKENCLNEKPNC